MHRFLFATLLAACSLAAYGCLGGNDTQKQAGDGSCSSVVQRGSPVASTCSTDTPPSMAGGTILDGTYVLTKDTNYDCSVLPAAASQTVTLVVSGSTLNSAITCDGCSPLTNNTFSTAGIQLLMATTCPANVGSSASEYTATASDLSILVGNHLLQYTKL